MSHPAGWRAAGPCQWRPTYYSGPCVLFPSGSLRRTLPNSNCQRRHSVLGGRGNRRHISMPSQVQETSYRWVSRISDRRSWRQVVSECRERERRGQPYFRGAKVSISIHLQPPTEYHSCSLMNRVLQRMNTLCSGFGVPEEGFISSDGAMWNSAISLPKFILPTIEYHSLQGDGWLI